MGTTSSSDFTVLSLFLAVLFLNTITFAPVESAALGGKEIDPDTVIYRRYIRRRPVESRDYNYVDEYVEVFNTQSKPPVIWSPMTDEEVDKFIFCDFHREMEECKKYWNSINTKKSETPTTTVKPSNVRPTIKPSLPPPQATTTTRKAPTKPTAKTTTEPVKTTSTTTTTTTSTSTTTVAPTTEGFGRLPDIEVNSDDTDWDATDWDDTDFDDEEDYADQKTETKPFSLFGF